MDSNKLLKRKVLLRPDEVAAILRISKSSIYRRIKKGELRSVRVGGSTRVFADSVRMFLEKAEGCHSA